MNQKEVKNMTAMQEYLKGTPFMPDTEFDQLKTELKDEGSKFAVQTDPKCYIGTGVCKVTMQGDAFRSYLLYLPAGAGFMTLWLFFGYKLINPDRKEAIVSFIDGITESGLELVGQELELAEEKALLWLIDEETLELSPANEARFRQRYALATLWFQTGVTPWTANTENWLTTVVECDWAGVTCSTFDLSTTVETLKLPGSGLIGVLPPDLGLITSLTNVNLANNELNGTLPDALGSWKQVEQVNLNNNQLSGPISASATSWPKLQRLWLAGNEFTGAIPDALGANWPELSYVDFSTNQFSEKLPTSIGLWTNVEYIDLSNNAFTRQLPREIANWANIVAFNVSDNQLSGEIPAEIGSAWQNVLEVRVQQNNFTGALAEGFCERSVSLTVDCGAVTCSCCAAPVCYSFFGDE